MATGISPEMVVWKQAFGGTAESWLALQQGYDGQIFSFRYKTLIILDRLKGKQPATAISNSHIFP